MDGNPVKQLIHLSGMPENTIEPWFLAQIENRGLNPYDLSLDDIRDVLADILQDLILETSRADSA